MTKKKEDHLVDWARLKEPFHEHEIEWRVGRAGLKFGKEPVVYPLAYITARAVMDRLDEVFGPCGWRASFNPFGAARAVDLDDAGDRKPSSSSPKRIICCLTVQVPSTSYSTKDGRCWKDGGSAHVYHYMKEDGAMETDIEPFKGGLSDSLKRAAVHWGIGRYLYSLGEHECPLESKWFEGGRYHSGRVKVKGQEEWVSGYWTPPKLPDWALPKAPEPEFVPPGSDHVILTRCTYQGQKVRDIRKEALVTMANEHGQDMLPEDLDAVTAYCDWLASSKV